MPVRHPLHLGRLRLPARNLTGPTPAGRWSVALGATVALCAAARVAYLLSPKVAFSADEAVTGVMVRRILSGNRPAFYAGQHYGGTLEQYLQAVLYAVSRLPQNAVTLRLPQVLLSGLTCTLVGLVGARMLPSRRHALLAALLYAVGPWFNLVGNATSQGFYVVGQTLGLASWWVALRLRSSMDLTRWAAGLGLVTGMALWTSVTSVYFVAPALLWVVPSFGHRAAPWAAYGLGGLLGSAPVGRQLLTSGTLPVQSGVPVHTSVLDRLGNLFGPVLREFLGVSFGHDTGGVPRPIQYAAVAAFLAAYALALWRRRLGLRDVLSGSDTHRQPADLLLLVPPIVTLSYVASPSVWYVGTPRYLLIAYPLLGLGIAAVLPTVRATSAVVGFGLATAATAALSVGFLTAQGRSWVDQEPQLRRVLTVLAERHESAVFADYWTAMPLLYLADGAVSVGVSSGTARFPDEQRAVLAAADPVYLVGSRDGSAARLESALTRRQVTYRATTVGTLVIVDRLSRRTVPADLG